MRPSLLGIAAIVLASGAAVAAAADDTLNDLNLTGEQQRAIWQEVSEQHRDVAAGHSSAEAPPGFSAAVGATLPEAVAMRPLPTKVTNQYAAMRPYEYAMVADAVVIVNPKDRRIITIIRP